MNVGQSAVGGSAIFSHDNVGEIIDHSNVIGVTRPVGSCKARSRYDCDQHGSVRSKGGERYATRRRRATIRLDRFLPG
jgi:hypothetical protein